ncbi:hypothetical protein VN97_g9567 [Penicillium thymicola]|uniref:Uncharacterized protein n=1 Tax=Penicillium thymicola TaxID=293382 RepID=A0AAI9X4R1_PENTH|nr:hypothetical protein VN97_g9567 [Penicillium thymicola]
MILELSEESKPVTESVAAKPSEQPWKVLSQFLPFHSLDQKLWWGRLSPVIGLSLSQTGYSINAQYQNLLLVYSILIPYLGPFPNANRSNVTWEDSYVTRAAAIDVSVNYQRRSKPSYRIAFEPIGVYAGTESDPSNECALAGLLQELAHVQPGIDFTLFENLRHKLVMDNRQVRQHWDRISHLLCKSQGGIGLDFHESSFTVKLYLGAFIKSVATGTDWRDITFDGLKNLPNHGGLNPNLSKVKEYVSSTKHQLLDAETFVAFDSHSPQSRIKFYTGAYLTSLADVYDFWTLGGSLHGPDVEEGFAIVKKMWNLIYPQTLPGGIRRESMKVGFNWEMSPAAGSLAPKAYFLVHNDCDESVSKAILGLFGELGWDDHILTHQKLEEA